MFLRHLRERELSWRNPLVSRNFISSAHCSKLDVSLTTDVQRAHFKGIRSMDIDPVECRYLLSGGADQKIVLYDLESPTVAPAPPPKPASSLSSSSSSSSPSSAPRKSYRKVVRPLAAIDHTNPSAHSFAINAVQWYPHDTGMFVSSSMDKSVKVWDTNTLDLGWEFKLDSKVYSHSLSPVATKHTLIAVGAGDPKIRLCDIRTAGFTQTLVAHSEAVMAVLWSPLHEFLLASAGADRRILLWDIRKAGYLCELDQYNYRPSEISDFSQHAFQLRRAKSGGNAALAATSSGQALSAASDGQSVAHFGTINGLAFSSDGLYLFSTGTDNKIRCWDVMLATNTLVNYPHVRNGNKLPVKMALSGRAGGCRGVAAKHSDLLFHPNDSDIGCYDASSGELVRQLKGHMDIVNCCVFHPLKQELYTGGNDQILVWTPFGSQNELPDSTLEGRSRQSQSQSVAELERDRASVLFQSGLDVEDQWSSDDDDDDDDDDPVEGPPAPSASRGRPAYGDSRTTFERSRGGGFRGMGQRGAGAGRGRGGRGASGGGRGLARASDGYANAVIRQRQPQNTAENEVERFLSMDSDERREAFGGPRDAIDLNSYFGGISSGSFRTTWGAPSSSASSGASLRPRRR